MDPRDRFWILFFFVSLVGFYLCGHDLQAQAQPPRARLAHMLLQSPPVFPKPPQAPPEIPAPTEPILPGQPSPGLPQRDPIPGRPTKPQGERPAPDPEKMVVTPEHVRQAQEALRAKGLQPGAAGQMDERTQMALQQFQRMNDLPPTGLLDEKTAAKLGIDLRTRR